MSLIDQTNATAVIQNRTVTAGAHGDVFTPSGDPIELPVRLINVSSTETTDTGVLVTTLKRLLVRDWPGDVYSQITIDRNVYEPSGDPRPYNNSLATSHWEIDLKLVRRG